MGKKNDILLDGIDERIETFLRGEMSVEEEATFKQEIIHNQEIRNRAKTIASLIKELHNQNSAREESIIKETETDNGEGQNKPGTRQLLWWIFSAAAVLVIAFGIYKDHRYRLLDATVSPYYTQYDMSDISRGDAKSDTITHLYGLYTQIQKNRSVSDIIEELEPIYTSLDKDFTYYPWANDIAWNLALAYVKDDQIDKAISILQKIKADNPDTPIYNKADKLIEKLSDL